MRHSTSLAAVFRAVGQPLTLEHFHIPELAGSEALVRIRCATICGSDLHSFFGRRPAPVPSVLGHEMVGEIVAMGPNGTCDFRGQSLSIGDRVTWSMVWSCGSCFYCLLGLRPKCERLMKFGHEAMTPNRALIGGMAEYCWLPEDTAIFRVPSNLTDSVASPANCATATVAAVFRNAGSVKNQIVVIHGAGMLGQTACAMASHTGASKVIALDHNSHRCTQSLKFGAHLTLPPDQATARVHDLTSGRGADICLEFAGQPESFELGINLLRVGGKLVLAGATFPAKPVPIQAEQIVRRMLQITGVYNYSPEDLEAALAFLSATVIRFPFDELVGATYRLKEVNAAMDFAETKRPPRVALIP